MRWRIALVVTLFALFGGGAMPAGAALATGTVTDPVDAAVPLDVASATLTDSNGTVTLTVTTHEPFTDEATAFTWMIQGRDEDNPDAFAAADFDQQSGEIRAFLVASPGGTVTASRPDERTLVLTFARNALGPMGPLSFLMVAGDDTDGDGEYEEGEVDSAPDSFDAAVFRFAGADRIATALVAWGANNDDAVVLARSDDFADALAGVPLAVANNAPILLTPSDQLDSRVRSALQQRLERGRRVFLLGGPSALSPAIAEQLTADGYEVVRLFGADRFETAVVIARDGLGSPDVVVLTTGAIFADALSAGAAAAVVRGAVLLTDGTTMPPAVRSHLDTATPGERWAVGGPAATAAPEAQAIVGDDRYETAVFVADAFFGDAPVGAGIVSGENFPDALAAGAVVVGGDEVGPVLLTRPAELPASTSLYLDRHSDSIESAAIFGGTQAIAAPISEQVETAIR